MTLRVRNLSAAYSGSVRHALERITFAVEPARTLAVVGPSGAGKSTLLRVIAGLMRPLVGEITFEGDSIAQRAAQDRRVAVVFAQDALLHHLTIRANLAFAMRDRTDAASRIESLARALDIDRHLERHPDALSTGERQRVSIARALLSDPRVLLLDEPLAPLDPELRTRVRDELIHVRERFAGPMILVTHDHAEAMSVADDLAVLIDGSFEDYGDPQHVYDYPATAKAAAFLGTRPMNLLDGSALGEPPGVIIGIRPERVRVVSEGMLRGEVTRIERTGADAYVHVATGAGRLLVRVDAATSLTNHTEIGVEFSREDVRRYDRATGEALR